MMHKILIICLSFALSLFTAYDFVYAGQSSICEHKCDSETPNSSDQGCGDCLVQTNTPHLTTTFSFNARQLVTKLFTYNNFFYKNLIQLYNYSLPPPKSY